MAETKEKDMKDITADTEQVKCAIQKALLFLNEFIEGPMCARCLPCPMGSYEMRVRFEKLAQGSATPADVKAIEHIAPLMFDSSMCKKGKDTAKFIMDTLANTPEIYTAHVEGDCPDRECLSLVVYRVLADKCAMCNDCKAVCKDFAILGEKKIPFISGFRPYEIIEQRCTKCGECIKVCQYGAIEIVGRKDKEHAMVCEAAGHGT